MIFLIRPLQREQSGRGWETADEYLSGNVRDKLRVAKAMAADTDNPQAERFAGNAAALREGSAGMD